jgi:hypothetical protein
VSLGEEILVHKSDGLARLLFSVSDHWKTEQDNLVLPARTVHGICASIGRHYTGSSHEVAQKIHAQLRIGPKLTDLPQETILHITQNLGYSELRALRLSNPVLRDAIDGSHLLFNYTNTNWLLMNFVIACDTRNMNLFDTCARTAARIGPVFLPLFINILVGLCAWVPIEENPMHHVRLVINVIRKMKYYSDTHENVRRRLISDTYFRTLPPHIQGGHYLGYDPMDVTGRHRPYFGYLIAYLEAGVTVTKVADVLAVRAFAAQALDWIYSNAGPDLDPDQTLLCTCWFDTALGITLPVAEKQQKESTCLLPSTASTALRIMSRCTIPELTVAAFIYQKSTSVFNPAFHVSAAFCADAAIKLAARSGCLTRLMREVAFVDQNLVNLWTRAALSFFEANESDLYLRDYEAETALSADETAFLLNARTRWQTAHPVPAVLPSAAARTGTVPLFLISPSAARLYGNTDRAFINSLFSAAYVDVLIKPEKTPNINITAIISSIQPNERRKLLHSQCLPYIVHYGMLRNMPALDEGEVVRVGFWQGLNRWYNHLGPLLHFIVNPEHKLLFGLTANIVLDAARNAEQIYSAFERTVRVNSSLATIGLLPALLYAERIVASVDFYDRAHAGSERINTLHREKLDIMLSIMNMTIPQYETYKQRIATKAYEARIAADPRDRQTIKNELFSIYRDIDFELYKKRLVLSGTVRVDVEHVPFPRADPNVQLTNPKPALYYGAKTVGDVLVDAPTGRYNLTQLLVEAAQVQQIMLSTNPSFYKLDGVVLSGHDFLHLVTLAKEGGGATEAEAAVVQHLMHVDLLRPILVVRIERHFYVLDGIDRLAYAMMQDLPQIRARVIERFELEKAAVK